MNVANVEKGMATMNEIQGQLVEHAKGIKAVEDRMDEANRQIHGGIQRLVETAIETRWESLSRSAGSGTSTRASPIGDEKPADLSE
eukprot:4536483-Pyramimonas_sp.AAC.1